MLFFSNSAKFFECKTCYITNKSISYVKKTDLDHPFLSLLTNRITVISI